MKILKKSPRIILLLSLSFCVAFLSCQKEEMEPELVPITTSGKNTMGFYVDGELVNIEGEFPDGGTWCSSCGITGGLYVDGTTKILASGNEPSWTIVIYFPIDSLSSSNEITIDTSIYRFKQIEYTDDSPLGGRVFTCDPEHQGIIRISRLDDHIISGTFEFEGIHKESGETIHVTDGRFDIKLD